MASAVAPSFVLLKHRRKASSAWSKTVEVMPSAGSVQTSQGGTLWNAFCSCWAFAWGNPKLNKSATHKAKGHKYIENMCVDRGHIRPQLDCTFCLRMTIMMLTFNGNCMHFSALLAHQIWIWLPLGFSWYEHVRPVDLAVQRPSHLQMVRCWTPRLSVCNGREFVLT